MSLRQKAKAVALVGTCPRCKESVELIVSKKQLKALLKGFKESSPANAEMAVERVLGRTRKGDLKI